MSDAIATSLSASESTEKTSDYDAFLSYDHDDELAAVAIQKALHRIGRRFLQLRALRVFRDKTNLPATDDLRGAILNALDRSRYFIVVLSPAAAESSWVNDEIQHWLERHGTKKMSIILVGGKLQWDADRRSFDAQQSSSATPALIKPDLSPTEPLWIDLTKNTTWDPDAPELRSAVTAVAAPIQGKQNDELASDDLTARRRLRFLTIGVIVALTILAAATGIGGCVAYSQKKTADKAAREATVQRLVAEAQAMLAQVRPGGDVEALHRLLIAQKLAGPINIDAVLTALVDRIDTERIVETARPQISVAVSADEQLLATAGVDGKVRLWNADTGQLARTPYDGTGAFVQSVAFSPHGHQLAAAYTDGAVKLWDVDSADRIGKTLAGNGKAARTAIFSPVGDRLAVTRDDGTVWMWDSRTTQPIGTPLIRQPVPVGALPWVPPGQPPSAPYLDGIAISPDGRRIATGGADGRVLLWDAASGTPLNSPDIRHAGSVTSVAFSPDGQRLVSGSWDGTARVWNSDTGDAIGAPIPAHIGFVNAVAFSPEGRDFVTVGNDSEVRLWSLDSRQPHGDPLVGHTGPVSATVFFPDGHRIATVSADSTLRVWNPYLRLAVVGSEFPVDTVIFSPDGRRLATADGNKVRLWDSETGYPLGAPLEGPQWSVNALVFEPDGVRIGAGSIDGGIWLWNLTGDRVATNPIAGHLGRAETFVAISADMRRVATSNGDQIRVWDTVTKQPVGPPIADPGDRIALSPDGRRLAATGVGGLRIYNTEDAKPVAEPPAEPATTWITSVVFSADGRFVATGEYDSTKTESTAKLWNVATGIVEKSLSRSHFVVNDIALSSDGQRIALGGDGGLLLYDTSTGSALGNPLQGHHDDVTSVAFSADGRSIATGSRDRSVRLWPGSTSPDMLCAKLSSDLNAQQWAAIVAPLDAPYEPTCRSLPASSGGA